MKSRDPASRNLSVVQPGVESTAPVSVRIPEETAAAWEKAAGILEEKDTEARRIERIATEARELQYLMGLSQWTTGLRLLKAGRCWIPIGMSTPGTTSRYWLGGSGFVRTSVQIQSKDVSDLSKHLKHMEILSGLPEVHLKQLIENYIRDVGLGSSELLADFLIRMITSVAKKEVSDKPTGGKPEADKPIG